MSTNRSINKIIATVDIESGELFWVSGIKKNGEDRLANREWLAWRSSMENAD